MNRTVQVAAREYMENLRTKTFWIGILAVPVLIALAIGGQILLSKVKDTKVYAILDYSKDKLADPIQLEATQGDLKRIQDHLVKGATEGEDRAETFRKARAELADKSADHPLHQFLDLLERDATQEELLTWTLANATRLQDMSGLDTKKYQRKPLDELGDIGTTPEDQEAALNKKINSGELFAYFVLSEDPVESFAGCRYVSNNLTDDDLRTWYSRAATKVVRDLRIARANIEPSVARHIQEALSFQEKQVTEAGATAEVDTAQKANKWAPVVFVYLLWIAVFTAAQMLLTNTVEEKSNRIIEVLLSSVSPRQLMSGKIWGIAATGLTIIGSWVAFAIFAVFVIVPAVVPAFDVAIFGAVIGDPLYIVSFLAYFLAGYLLYAAVLVAIGSVCNSLKEAQNLMQPVIIVLIVPLIAMVPIVNEPNGTVAKVLTYIPLFTPFTMMNRASGPPPAWEYAVTGVIIVLTIIIAFWAAAKIFRIGVLMTGKPPRIKEILGWLKAPVGAVHVRRTS